MSKIAVVTGASSGIGAATARLLAAMGWQVIIGARRITRLQALADEIGASAIALDVADPASVAAFARQVPPLHVLVNNAGGALGLTRLADMDENQWLSMYQSNVLGLARMSQALLPQLRASGDGHVVNMGSIAALETYVGGAGYAACKHAVRAISETMRLEWLGEPIRVTEIDPGLVETEFSLVRFGGDADRAAQVYEGVQALTAQDVAEAVAWVVTRPTHVNVDQLVIKPRAQARVDKVFRQGR